MQTEMEKLLEIVRKAGELMQIRDMEVQQKGNASNYVTSRDIAVENFLTENLLRLLPGSAVVGEENSDRQSVADAKAIDFVWVIDPIDGTSNFIRDLGASAVSVGLLKKGEPYLGVIYQPYRDEMYYAETGKGTYLNGKRIHVSDRDYAHAHLCSAMSLYDKRFAPPCFRIIERVYAECDDLRRFGSAATELAYLSAGRVELYFEIRLMPWDAAAAFPIIREAGGYAQALYQDGFPIDRPFPVIAANTKENFEKLRAVVTQEVPKVPY